MQTVSNRPKALGALRVDEGLIARAQMNAGARIHDVMGLIGFYRSFAGQGDALSQELAKRFERALRQEVAKQTAARSG